MKQILITDSLFIYPEHEEKLRNAGFEITRLDKPQATEAELIQAVAGKHGYLLGGIEQITDAVIDAADKLEAICFTGSDWRWFIPGYELATNKGIAITNCPGANAGAVAEYTLSLMLAMTRQIFDMGRTGDKTFRTTKTLQGSTVGIVGMGHIGERVVHILKTFGVSKILYYSRTRKENLESELGIEYASLEDLCKQSDVVTLHAPKIAGKGYFNRECIENMRDGTLLINCSFDGAVDMIALYEHLQSGRIMSAMDDTNSKPQDVGYNDLPLSVWYTSNAPTAYNTEYANKLASDIATDSIINLLTTGPDQYVVNK